MRHAGRRKSGITISPVGSRLAFFRGETTFPDAIKNARIWTAPVDCAPIAAATSVATSFSLTCQQLSLDGPTETPDVVRSKQRGDLVSLPESVRRAVPPPTRANWSSRAVRFRAACEYDRPTALHRSGPDPRTCLPVPSEGPVARSMSLRQTRWPLSAGAPDSDWRSDSRESARTARGWHLSDHVLLIPQGRRRPTGYRSGHSSDSMNTANSTLQPPGGNKEQAVHGSY